MAVENKVAVVVGMGVGLMSLAGIGFLWRFWKSEKPPKKWRKVGELSDLMCFPIKSAGVIRLEEIDCSMIGIRDGFLRDRIFMCVTLERHFVTCRTHPKLVLIQPRFKGNLMILSAPDMPDISLDVSALESRPRLKAIVWGQLVESVDCGEEIATWLSTFLMGEESGMKLVYYPPRLDQRCVREKNRMFETVEQKDCGTLHDATSYNLMSESSVEDLNGRLKNPVTVQQFRPNFVVKGSNPFEEDDWKWIRIGEEAIFRNILPCTRCLLTTVNPFSGVKDREALTVLKGYRPKITGDPVLGIHLGLRRAGRVKVGDAIYVEDD